MNRKMTAAILVDLLIIAVSILCAVLTYLYVPYPAAQTAVYLVLPAIVAGLVAWELYSHWPKHGRIKEKSSPFAIVLLGERGKELQSWELSGFTGFLIGRSAGDIQADADLSHSAYREFVDPAHLALNYSANGWWAQDLSSRNGSGIRREGKDILLSPGIPVQVYAGDVIILADSVQLALR